MSIEAMAIVFDLQVEPMKKWVLMSLADCANKEWSSIYPSVETICHKTSLPERTVQRCLSSLRKDGLVEVVRVARAGRGTEYKLNLPGFEPDNSTSEPRITCPPRLRRQCIKAFNYTCEYCQKKGTLLHGPDGEFWTIDRIISGKHGGEYKAENICLSCRACNITKGTNHAPDGTRSMGATQAPVGCHTGTRGVPSSGTRGVPSSGTQSTREPSGNPTPPTPPAGGDSPGEPVEPTSKAKRKRASRPKPPADPRWQDFIDTWVEAYQTQFGIKYAFEGRDAKALAEFLKLVTMDVGEIMETALAAWPKMSKKGNFKCNLAGSIHSFLRWFNDIRTELSEHAQKGEHARQQGHSESRTTGTLNEGWVDQYKGVGKVG